MFFVLEEQSFLVDELREDVRQVGLEALEAITKFENPPGDWTRQVIETLRSLHLYDYEEVLSMVGEERADQAFLDFLREEMTSARVSRLEVPFIFRQYKESWKLRKRIQVIERLSKEFPEEQQSMQDYQALIIEEVYTGWEDFVPVLRQGVESQSNVQIVVDQQRFPLVINERGRVDLEFTNPLALKIIESFPETNSAVHVKKSVVKDEPLEGLKDIHMESWLEIGEGPINILEIKEGNIELRSLEFIGKGDFNAAFRYGQIDGVPSVLRVAQFPESRDAVWMSLDIKFWRLYIAALGFFSLG